MTDVYYMYSDMKVADSKPAGPEETQCLSPFYIYNAIIPFWYLEEKTTHGSIRVPASLNEAL